MNIKDIIDEWFLIANLDGIELKEKCFEFCKTRLEFCDFTMNPHKYFIAMVKNINVMNIEMVTCQVVLHP